MSVIRSRQKKKTDKKPGAKRARDEAGAKTDATKKDAPQGPLTGAAARYLRALGHTLDPVIRVGKEGITESLVAETRTVLLRHELVKGKVQGEAPVDRIDAARALAEATGAALAQVLGRTFLLYKQHPKTPKIVLPRGGKARAPAGRTTPVATSRHARDEEE